MPSKPLPLFLASLLLAAPVGAQITITSKDVTYLNGAATPSTMVPLGTYAWTRSASFEGQYDAPPPAGQQPSIASYATTPAIDPVYAANAMRDLNVPEGFEGRPWGTPPLVNHPTAVAAAPDGTVYVAMDGSGSLSAFGHLGRIVRLRDTNRDGELDEVKPFVPDIDSPRGLIWDHDHLIVMAPPNVTSYADRDGDGIAEERKVLVSGMGWPLTMALADHSIQNIEIGIDGWVYLAVGDIGIFKATGSDGRTLQMRSGGIVRFRTDGSGMEIFAAATRNNYGVAISPLLDVFSRDNTNDGGGWDVRLHHFTGLTDHGYPSLFVNFSEEVITPLAQFGGGSGVGAMWLDEPAIPEKWRGLTTADYGQRALFHHALVPKGATYSLPGYAVPNGGVASSATPPLLIPGQENPPAGNEPFLEAANPMDADVDANGNIYLIAWRGGGFTWTGTQFGMVYKVSPKGNTPAALPDFDRISATELVQILDGPSNVRRIEAQRAILRRKAQLGPQAAPLLQALAADRAKPLASRVAALFTDKQLRGAQATASIAQLAADPTIAAWAIKALGDDLAQAKSIPLPVVTAALRSTDPRTRKEAVITLARADSLASAPAITALLSDSDPVVAHTAVQALRSLRAVEASLAVVDAAPAASTQRKGALMVLQSIHEARVTDALIQRLARDQSAASQNDLVGALARLANTEAQWNGSWWNTRPSTVGPYYAPAPWPETAKVMAALNGVLNRAGPEQTLAIARQYVKQGVSAGPAVSKFLALADTEPALLPQITSYFATAEEIPAAAVPVLLKAAATPANAAALRAEAVAALARTSDRASWAALVPAAATIGQAAPAAAAGRGAAAAVPAGIPGATAIQQMLVTSLTTDTTAQAQALATARTALTAASFTADAATLTARAGAVAQAEEALALARANAFSRIQASVARLNTAQVAALAAQSATAAAPAAAAAGRGGAAAGGRGGAAVTPAEQARRSIFNSARLDEVYPVLVDEAAKLNGDSSQLADAALLNIAARRFGAAAPREAAARALDAGWANPARRLQIILAAVTAGDTTRAPQIITAASDTDAAVARAASYAMQQLSIDPAVLAAAAAGPKIGNMGTEAILAAVVPARGTVARGAQLVKELGCVACHTTAASETPKGPPLNLVSKILARRELAEAILLPNKSMSQGFPTNQITRRSGGTITGFVVQETPATVTLQDITTQQTRIPVSDIATRTSIETSIMPQGLTGNLTVTEFASLLDYLESLGR
jgi:putative heme-binding domain-containing protein